MLQSEPSILWPQVVKFIGQLNHDIRNHLNAIELQSAFLGEIVEAGEAKDEVRRLREMTAEMGGQLQRLSGQLSKIQLNTMPYPASEFVEDLRAKITADHPEQTQNVEWQLSLGAESIEIDPQLLLDAFAELFSNAFAHQRGEGPLVFEARADGTLLSFTLREPKSQPVETNENWGGRPLTQLRHGHYALGLFRARSIFEAHHGTFHARFDPPLSVLTTTVVLPRASA
ncbi:MAG: HAMP domain-containing histidine kinase [Chthoniobacterales bacterium]|nr:HAMP domain-containing histidine kinase [Chthoniobacterales bacterium]